MIENLYRKVKKCLKLDLSAVLKKKQDSNDPRI